jgi:hypothetical protein
MPGVCGRAKSCSPQGHHVKEEEEGTGCSYPLEGTPNDLGPPTKPHLLKALLPSSSAKLGANPLPHGPLGVFPDPNYSRI